MCVCQTIITERASDAYVFVARVEQGRPQGERPSHVTVTQGERVRVWEGRSPCGCSCLVPILFPLYKLPLKFAIIGKLRILLLCRKVGQHLWMAEKTRWKEQEIHLVTLLDEYHHRG